MKRTDQTLLEQMRITELEVEHRKSLFSFSPEDAKLLLGYKREIEKRVDALVDEFYQRQTSIADIALLIGDADTLSRLRNAQRRYINDLFSGTYDLEYVNNRLRIGLVHKRIGVEPKLYLSAVHSLKILLFEVLIDMIPGDSERRMALRALDRLLQFDVTLVFETYIRSMLAEIESAKEKSDRYAQRMEQKVMERTRELETMSRTDPLTGLLNVRHLNEIVTTTLRSAERRHEPVTSIYIDVNDFKKINDTQGHQSGDEILRTVGRAIKSTARAEDVCIRYGGDEFFIVLANCLESQAHELFANRLRAKIHEDLPDVTLSIGIAQTGPGDYVDADALIRLADEKMYADKQARKRLDNPAGVQPS